jgi:hypothetical protein
MSTLVAVPATKSVREITREYDAPWADAKRVAPIRPRLSHDDSTRGGTFSNGTLLALLSGFSEPLTSVTKLTLL